MQPTQDVVFSIFKAKKTRVFLNLFAVYQVWR